MRYLLLIKKLHSDIKKNESKIENLNVVFNINMFPYHLKMLDSYKKNKDQNKKPTPGPPKTSPEEGLAKLSKNKKPK